MDSAKVDETTVPDDVLDNLEREFNEAMTALAAHENFGRFRSEYEKLHRALRKSHESEKRLVKRCQQLTQELMSNTAKMQAALKLSHDDHSTIEALKRELEKAWRMVDAANEKDARAKETVKTLKEEVATLQEIMDSGNTLTSSHTATLEELKLEKKRMQLEYDELTKQMENFTREFHDAAKKEKELEADIANHNDELRRVTDRERSLQEEFEKEVKARERADVQVRELLLVVQQRGKELKSQEQLHASLTTSVGQLLSQVKGYQEKHQGIQQKIEMVEKQLYHTQQSYDDALDTTGALNERIREVRAEIAEAEKKAIDLRAEEQQTHRLRDNDFKELHRLVQQNEDIRKDQENLKRQEVHIRKRISAVQKEQEDMRQARDLLLREQESLKKCSEKEREKIQLIKKIIENEVESQKEAEAAIAREREIGVRLRQTLARLESEREKYVHEVSQVTLHHTAAREELKVATITCEETQKAIEENEQLLKKQQSVYEQVRAERNLYSKRLIESQDEVVELKQSFRMMEHQIRQLKDEFAMKEKKLREEASAQKMANEKLTKVRKLVNDCTAALDDENQKCENVSQQINQLVKVIDRCDKELSQQQQRFLTVSGERDLLGTQLIRRNNELALLYEKMRLQQGTLAFGDAALHARLEDIRLLRLKIADLNRQSAIAQTLSHNSQQLKEDIKQLQYDLTVERAKVQALTEEVESPKNTLHWKKMEGREPTQEELDHKITRLQRRLITKSEECVEKDMELQEKQRLVTELQNILARQPGPEVAQQLNAYQKDMQRTCTVMKQKASELNMTSTHILELKYEAERLRRELHETKRKYYEMRMSNNELSQGLLGGKPPQAVGTF